MIRTRVIGQYFTSADAEADFDPGWFYLYGDEP